MTSCDGNPVLQLLIARKYTVTLKQRETAARLYEWLHKKHPSVCEILLGAAEPPWSQAEAEKFASEILMGEWTRAQAVAMLAAFATVIDQANVIYGGSLITPPVPTIRIRPTTPWLPNEVSRRRDAGVLVKICEQLIRDAMSIAGVSEEVLPLLTASALVFGGIANQKSLVSLIRAIASKSTAWIYFGERVELELQISAGKALPPERRVWYPDTLSSLLLLRFADRLRDEANAGIFTKKPNLQKTDQQILSWIWTHLLRDFRDQAKKKNLALKKLDDLIQILTVRYRRKLPPFIVSYMTRAITSSSLRGERLAYIHGLSAPAKVKSVVKPGDDSEPEVQIEEEAGQDPEDDRMRSSLRAVFSGSDRQQIRTNLLVFARNCDDMPARRTAECAAFLLHHQSAWGRHLRISSVKEYTRLIASMLWGILDGADPKHIPAAELSGYYSEILEEVSNRDALRQSLSRALNEFHFFLMTKYQVDPVDFREFGLGNSRAGSVDPNLITDAEAGSIRDSIKSNASFPEEPLIVRAALVVFLLGKGGGTRRNETRYIRASDVIYEDRDASRIAEILVRPWGPHEQKSRHAARRLSMDLYEPEEREIIEHWIRDRFAASGMDKNTLLLDWSIKPNGFAFNKIIAVVLRAMRAVTSDPSIRFHHLRHTFCSRLLVELILVSEGIVDLEKCQWPRQLLGVDIDPKAASNRFRILCGTSKATRKVLFAIAQALGHAGTDTSCIYYLHVLDGLMAILLDKSDLAPSKRVIAAASGLSESGAYGLMAKYGKWRLASRLLPPQNQYASPVPPEVESGIGLWTENLWNFLSRAGSPITPVPLEELAVEYGFDPIKALRMVDCAKELSTMRSIGGTFKFKMIVRQDSGERFGCPRKVHLRANRELASTSLQVLPEF